LAASVPTVNVPWWENESLHVDRIIYATITLMSVLIVYDGWETLSF
jgi:hypothetical protein